MQRLLTIACLLLILAACNTPTRTPTRIAPGLTVVPDASPTLDESDSPTSVLIPSATPPRIQDCPAAPPSQLIVQERGQVTNNNDSVNMRRGPGIDYEVVTRIEAGQIFMVLDGPACAGDYTWFRVRYDAGDVFYEGWIAEGDFDQYYVIPYLPG